MRKNMNRKEKKLSPSKQARERRNAKILALYEKLRGDYVRAFDCYMEIAQRTGCSHATVMSVLKDNGLIGKQQQS